MTAERNKIALVDDAMELQNAVLRTISNLVECRDDLTGGHVERIGRFLGLMIEELRKQDVYTGEIASWDIEVLIRSAQLHDVGKIAIRDSILLKPARLTTVEFAAVKQHTILGEQIIDKIQRNAPKTMFLTYARIIAGAHHEKWDGSGYPRSLTGTHIPLQGRLMALADVYDTLISPRPYKNAYTPEQAAEIIREESGRHFDPTLTGVFLNARRRFQNLHNLKMIPTDAEIDRTIAWEHANLPA
jgi:putative two-component system response regulator